eukprot:2701031-Rhodomonas_salina.1
MGKVMRDNLHNMNSPVTVHELASLVSTLDPNLLPPPHHHQCAALYGSVGWLVLSLYQSTRCLVLAKQRMLPTKASYHATNAPWY